MEKLTVSPIEARIIASIQRMFIKTSIKIKIEELDPNVLSKNMIEKVSIIYGKNSDAITKEDVELINALYKINVEDKK